MSFCSMTFRRKAKDGSCLSLVVHMESQIIQCFNAMITTAQQLDQIHLCIHAFNVTQCGSNPSKAYQKLRRICLQSGRFGPKLTSDVAPCKSMDRWQNVAH